MARDSGGTYSRPAGQPVVTGTTIDAPTFNTLTADIASELTDSLSRSGKGGMTAALKEINGTVSAPSYAFTNDAGVGAYRSASGEGSLAAGGADAAKWTVAGFFASLIQSVTTVTLRLVGRMVDGASAVGVVSDTATTYSTAGAKIHSFRNNTSEKAYIDKDGFAFFGGSAVPLPVTLVKSADQSTTNSGATNITDFSFAVVANGVYMIEVLLACESAGADSLIITWTGPASANRVSYNSQTERNADTLVQEQGASTTGSSWPSHDVLGGKANASIVHHKMLLDNGANAGTMQMQFRNGAGVVTVTIYKGSTLTYTRVV